MIIQEIDQTSEHLATVKCLGAANAQTLGFFPEGAFDDYARRRQIIIAINESGKCVGYLLYRISQDRAIIVHLCVDSQQRDHGVARGLVDYLKKAVKDLRGIGLRCRRDYEASKIWHKLGFVALYDQPGRGKIRTNLTYWWFDNGHPTLFSDALLENIKSKLCVVIDANVFFDLNDKTRRGHEESSSLLADWLSDNIELCLTDEIFNEINRSSDEVERNRERQLAKNFTSLPCHNQALTTVAEALRDFFPEKMSTRDESDLWQLARAIASNAQFFVTRDEGLLNLSDKVYESFGITVIRPTDLIIQLDELRREAEYLPQRLAGTLSEIRLVQGGQELVLTKRFQSSSLGENKATFQQLLRNLLSNPERNRCYVALDIDKLPIALFAYDRELPHLLDIPLLRVGHSPLAATLARYLIFRAVLQSAQENRIVTKISDPFQDETIKAALSEDAFVQRHDGWIKINLPVAKTARQLAEYLLKLNLSSNEEKKYCQELADVLNNAVLVEQTQTMIDIERLLWPAKILDAYIPTFIVPIRPEWAKELFDEGLASQTLFGPKDELALNREGVYYRAKSPSAGLKAPGRILWYVSYGGRFSGTGHLRACSRLDEVIVDKPKSLYRQFRRLGVYEWLHVFDLAKRNIENEIMALRFSDTELFSTPIGWNELQQILRAHDCRSQLQSPVRISPELFAKLYTSANQIHI